MYYIYIEVKPQNLSKTLTFPRTLLKKMMYSPETTTASSKIILSVATSLAASAILFQTIDNVVPTSVQDYFHSCLQRLSARLLSQLTVVVQEFDGLIANHMFEAANVYLGEKQSPLTSRIKVNKIEKERELAVTIDKGEELVDLYNGVKFKWVLVSSRNDKPVSNTRSNQQGFAASETRHFELSFHKKHRDMVLRYYLPYVLEQAKAIREQRKTVKLHTIDYNGTDYWSSINLDHPATFHTLAMDPDLKNMLMEDLDRFRGRKEYYRRVGKAWKRGYLLYGPPGTGKSSLVAAMANYLKFDIYDMDLKEVQCNSDLRRLLIGTASKSILVIEDIDCSTEMQNRESNNKAMSSEDEKVSPCFSIHIIEMLQNNFIFIPYRFRSRVC